MFGGVNLAIHFQNLGTQNLLRARNADVVHRLEAKMTESGAQARRRCQHQAYAGGAAVEIECQMRPQQSQAGGIGREDLIDIRHCR